MAEAIPSLLSQPSTGIAVLARQRAIKATKRHLQAQGIRPTQLAHRDIVAAADSYLRDHRAALIEDAVEMVRGSPALLAMYEKEQRQRQRLLERNSQQMHNAPTPALQGPSVCTIQVQNGEPK
jgi:hypothetical protein